MPERHVVERVVHRHVHVIHAAQLDLVVGAIGRRAVRRHQLVRQHNVAFPLVDIARTQHRTQCGRIVIADSIVGEEPAHVAGLQKRQQPELHRPMLVLKLHPLDFALIHRRQANALLLQQSLRVRDALGRIMVTGDGQHAQTRCHRIGQKRIEHGNRLGARRCLVVDVAGNQQHADLVLLRNIQYLPQNMALIVQHRHAVNALPDMQIGNMQHLHHATPFVESRITGPAPRTAQTMYHHLARISNSCTMHGTATAFSRSRQQLIAHSGYRIAINLANARICEHLITGHPATLLAWSHCRIYNKKTTAPRAESTF